MTDSTENPSAYNQLLHLVEEMKTDATKFYEKNNTTAGTRLRKHLFSLKSLAHQSRKDIQERINGVKTERKATKSSSDDPKRVPPTKKTKKTSVETPVVETPVVETAQAPKKKKKTKAKASA